MFDEDLLYFDAPKEKSENKVEKIKSRCIKTNDKQFYKRFCSERELEEIVPWQFEQNSAYHVISGGDIDSLSFLKMVARQQKINYLVCSTWCMALQDVIEFERYLRLKVINRIDFYVGEIFKSSYSNEYKELCRISHEYGGRVAMFKNHSKVFAGFGDKFDFAIESSANINTNPRTENTVITINSDLAYFYKDFFDGINSFGNEFKDWKPIKI